MSLAYLNGHFVPLKQAQVSALDRGFLFGDGVYELIPVYGGRLFRLQQHLARLADSLAAVRIENPKKQSDWTEMLAELAERNGGGDQALYLQVTRGVDVRKHSFSADLPPTVFAMSLPAQPLGREAASKAVTQTDYRWLRCDIKSTALLSNVLLRQHAEEQGAVECILIRNGFVTEGAASNVFTVTAGHIKTPPRGRLLLSGVTRGLVLELASEHGLPCAEAAISETELRSADEIWVTSSTMEVRPIVELDGVVVGTGQPGALWERINAAFQEHKQRVVYGTSG